MLYNKTMSEKQNLNNKRTPAIKRTLLEKRNELIFALLEPEQGYTYTDIGIIFNDLNRSTILRIARKKPKNYKPKWIKIN